MAIETKPAWVEALKRKLAEPYSEEERARIQRSFETIERLNAGKEFLRGTSQRLQDMADAEDAADEEVILAEWKRLTRS